RCNGRGAEGDRRDWRGARSSSRDCRGGGGGSDRSGAWGGSQARRNQGGRKRRRKEGSRQGREKEVTFDCRRYEPAQADGGLFHANLPCCRSVSSRGWEIPVANTPPRVTTPASGSPMRSLRSLPSRSRMNRASRATLARRATCVSPSL